MTPPSHGGLVRLRATPDDGASPAASRSRRPCAPLPVDANRRGGRATDAVLPDAPGRTPAGAGEGEARRAGGVRHEERRAAESARAARTTTAIARGGVSAGENHHVCQSCVSLVPKPAPNRHRRRWVCLDRPRPRALCTTRANASSSPASSSSRARIARESPPSTTSFRATSSSERGSERVSERVSE